MIDELQNAFANQILADASWMSEETKQKTLEKLQKMTVLVGYPDWIKVFEPFYSNSRSELIRIIKLLKLSNNNRNYQAIQVLAQ